MKVPHLYQHYRAEHKQEACEKYICHLSNYLNAPRRMQMNWLLQAANFNDCSQITSYCLIESEWNGRLKHKHTAVLTALTRDSLSKKEVLFFPGHIIAMKRTAQCRFVVWRKSAVDFLLSEPQRPVGSY